ncbi:thermonuclease family protein [Aquisphaera insulae]|uniref:thermonuclease family protein n=1 Tax=Aquisphaera insulae TaxID=2712864 RepID=UPI0013ED6EA9|nr:thermonuclease family protein [Aquisphaera insulae]
MIQRWVRRVLVWLVFAALIAAVLRSCPSTRSLAPDRRLRERIAAASRPAHVRVVVDPARVWVDDGDTIRIDWPGEARETVRILGIDAPEIHHRSRPGVGDQPYGRDSLDFARRHLLGAKRLEMARASHPDRFQRTLAYLYADGVNYSVLAVENHMAESTIGRFGHNGFPEEAARVADAAARAGPPPFESPVKFRDRNFGAVGDPFFRPE